MVFQQARGPRPSAAASMRLLRRHASLRASSSLPRPFRGSIATRRSRHPRPRHRGVQPHRRPPKPAPGGHHGLDRPAPDGDTERIRLRPHFRDAEGSWSASVQPAGPTTCGRSLLRVGGGAEPDAERGLKRTRAEENAAEENADYGRTEPAERGAGKRGAGKRGPWQNAEPQNAEPAERGTGSAARVERYAVAFRVLEVSGETELANGVHPQDPAAVGPDAPRAASRSSTLK